MRQSFQGLDLLAQLDELSETYSPQDHLEPAEHVALGLTSLRAILVELWPFEDRGCTVASDANPGPPSRGARQVVLAVSTGLLERDREFIAHLSPTLPLACHQLSQGNRTIFSI